MNNLYSKEEILEVARELIDGLEENHDIEDIVSGLEFIMEDENITLNEMREQCWNDSTEVFGKIYG